MINEIDTATVPETLSNACQKAYERIKALILKIFALLKKHKEEKSLKEEFYHSYIDFARKLKMEGYDKECYSYMSICLMYYNLIDRPEVLVAHENFFMDLFKAFDELLFFRKNNPNEYGEKYEEFLFYKGKMQEYYYTNLAIPSPYFNREVLNEITGYLVGDL